MKTSIKTPWLLSALSFALLGFTVAQSSHESIPTEIKNPVGKTVIVYSQRDPEKGKLVAIVSSLIVAGCLNQAFSDKAEKNNNSKREVENDRSEAVAVKNNFRKKVEPEVEDFKLEPSVVEGVEPILVSNAIPKSIRIEPDNSVPVTIVNASKPQVIPEQLEPQNDINPLIYDLLDEGCIWLIGRKGSGKTTKTEWFVENYLEQGYEVTILDPHSKAMQWKGQNVLGKGMNYREVERGLKAYVEEVTARYERMAIDEEYDAMVDSDRIIIVCEEMTKWGAEIDPVIMKAFMGCVLADIRKANAGCLFISHGETLNMFGGQQALAGFRDAIDTDIAKMICFSEAVPGSRPIKYRPTGEASIKMPSEKPRTIKVSNQMKAKGKFFLTNEQIELKQQEIRQAKRQSELENNIISFPENLTLTKIAEFPIRLHGGDG